MTGASWSALRRWRWWWQALAWVLLPPVPAALWAASRPPGNRRLPAALAAAVTVVWLALAIAGSGDNPERAAAGRTMTTTTLQRGEVSTTSTAAPETSTSSTAPTGTTAATEPKTTTTTATAATASTTTTTTAPTKALALLDRLRVAPEGPRTGYSRDLFPLWIDADGDRCDTREEVLIAESLTPAQVDPFSCKVVAGDWLSVYDGVTTEQPGDLDIDHVVALAEAWDSGASGWDLARRQAFANDLDHPEALIAVTASSNRSKGDRDPAEWRPPRPEAGCDFGTTWATVKVVWDLSADAAEVEALRSLLGGCGTAAPAPIPTTIPPPTSLPPASGSGVVVAALDCPADKVTVSNGTGSEVDLTGWTIHDEGTKHTFTFPAGYRLAPGAAVTVTSGGAAGPGELQWTAASVWNNDGDIAALLDPGGVIRSTKSC